MTLQLVKIVEGMGEGNVLYHSMSEFLLGTHVVHQRVRSGA